MRSKFSSTHVSIVCSFQFQRSVSAGLPLVFLTELYHFRCVLSSKKALRCKGFLKGKRVADKVLGRGLEPPWIAPLAPKASAYTNSATPARCARLFLHCTLLRM